MKVEAGHRWLGDGHSDSGACFTSGLHSLIEMSKCSLKTVRMFSKELFQPCKCLLKLFIFQWSGKGLGLGEVYKTVTFMGLCLCFPTICSLLIPLDPSLSLPLLVPINIP